MHHFSNRKVPLRQCDALSAGLLPVLDLIGQGSIMSALSGFPLGSAMFRQHGKYHCFEFTRACVHTRSAHESDLWGRGNRTRCRNITDDDECKHTLECLAEVHPLKLSLLLCHCSTCQCRNKSTFKTLNHVVIKINFDMKEKWNFSAATLQTALHIDAKEALTLEQCRTQSILESGCTILHTLDSLHDLTTIWK